MIRTTIKTANIVTFRQLRSLNTTNPSVPRFCRFFCTDHAAATTEQLLQWPPTQKTQVLRRLNSMTAEDFERICQTNALKAQVILERREAKRFKSFTEWVNFDGLEEEEVLAISKAVLEDYEEEKKDKPTLVSERIMDVRQRLLAWSPTKKKSVLQLLNSMTASEFEEIPAIGEEQASAILTIEKPRRFHRFLDWIHFKGLTPEEIVSISNTLLEYHYTGKQTHPYFIPGTVIKPTFQRDILPENIVTLQLTPRTLAWLEMTSSLEVKNWCIYELCDEEEYLRFFRNQEFHHQLFQIVRELPLTDVYLMEEKVRRSNKSKQQTGSVVLLNFALLENSLILLLNFSGQRSSSMRSNVYKMKDKMTSRFFDLSVGSERIDVQGKVSEVLKGSCERAEGVVISGRLSSVYTDAPPLHKQALGSCLLQAVTFYKTILRGAPARNEEPRTYDTPRRGDGAEDDASSVTRGVEMSNPAASLASGGEADMTSYGRGVEQLRSRSGEVGGGYSLQEMGDRTFGVKPSDLQFRSSNSKHPVERNVNADQWPRPGHSGNSKTVNSGGSERRPWGHKNVNSQKAFPGEGYF